MTLVIGLMSGTSVDGIDAVLVDISGKEKDLAVQLINAQTYAYEPRLKDSILDVAHGSSISLEQLAFLDDQIALAFATAAIAIRPPDQKVDLIGSHGQTVFHRPPQGKSLGYTIQLGRGDLIAHTTKIPTVSDFRVADIALGGQGAPLVPRIDVCLLSHPTHSRCVQNIGGMGNTTFLPSLASQVEIGQGVKGWDTGPGNVLIDLAVQHFSQGTLAYDRNGEWSAQGSPDQELVDQWLADPFFAEAPPKSTGREYFGADYLQRCLRDAEARSLSQADILASLTELTVQSIVQEYERFLDEMPEEVLLCGGGSRNTYLMQRLRQALEPIPLNVTDEADVNAEAKEAIAFAVLAYWHQCGIPGNLAAVTGARKDTVLGRFFPAID